MKDVSFRSFPQKKENRRRRKWLNAIRRPPDYEPKPWYRVCSRHFCLNSDIPSLFPWNNYGEEVLVRDTASSTQSQNDIEEENRQRNLIDEEPTVNIDLNVPDYSEEVVIDMKTEELQTLPDHTYHGSNKGIDTVAMISTAVQTDITLGDMSNAFEDMTNHLM